MADLQPDLPSAPRPAGRPVDNAAAASDPPGHSAGAPCQRAGRAAWRCLHDIATRPYRPGGRFAWHFARGKLGRDPVFRSVLERGDIPAGARVLDIGCGQGLFASLLAAVDQAAAAGQWPAGWPPPPVGCRYLGVELMRRDVARAESALGHMPDPPRFACADMRDAPLPASDLAVILDVLHYIDHPAQAALLHRVREALGGGGRLLLRIGDRASLRRFAVSQWVDRVVTLVRGHRVAPTFGRSLPEWTALLEGLGFSVRSVPMSAGTPFANVLLVGDLRGAVPAAATSA